MSKKLHQPFPNTHWSLVYRAGFGEGEARREALAVLLERYAPAMISYLRDVRRLPEVDAEDLVQEFIAKKVLDYEILQHAQQARGRFRTFILTSLNNFIIDRYRSEGRQVVAGTSTSIFDPTSPEAASVVEAAWARSLLHEVLENMEEDCRQNKRMDIWNVFERRVLAEFFENKQPESYESLAEDLKIVSPTQAANLLVTGKRMYARLLKAAVAEYEKDSAEIDQEIADLYRILSVPPID